MPTHHRIARATCAFVTCFSTGYLLGLLTGSATPQLVAGGLVVSATCAATVYRQADIGNPVQRHPFWIGLVVSFALLTFL
jgi:hypothetical protein